MKKSVAASLHEVFRLSGQEDDTSKLREALKNLLEESEKEI